jgi:hypothetical protein
MAQCAIHNCADMQCDVPVLTGLAWACCVAGHEDVELFNKVMTCAEPHVEVADFQILVQLAQVLCCSCRLSSCEQTCFFRACSHVFYACVFAHTCLKYTYVSCVNAVHVDSSVMIHVNEYMRVNRFPFRDMELTHMHIWQVLLSVMPLKPAAEQPEQPLGADVQLITDLAEVCHVQLRALQND